MLLTGQRAQPRRVIPKQLIVALRGIGHPPYALIAVKRTRISAAIRSALMFSCVRCPAPDFFSPSASEQNRVLRRPRAHDLSCCAPFDGFKL